VSSRTDHDEVEADLEELTEAMLEGCLGVKVGLCMLTLDELCGSWVLYDVERLCDE
jgi:hypothetical protein